MTDADTPTPNPHPKKWFQKLCQFVTTFDVGANDRQEENGQRVFKTFAHVQGLDMFTIQNLTLFNSGNHNKS